MVQIIAIVVLYKQTPSESVALRTLLAGMQGRELSLQLLIYDNSPLTQEPELADSIAGDINYTYFHDGQNSGLAAAYNFALEIATQQRVSWLMLLDQDTEITTGFLTEALRLSSSSDAGLCALVPRLIVHGEQRSPHLSGPAHASGRAMPTGRSEQRLAAWNSGAVLHVATLVSAGGFPRDFPLDNLDYAVFHLLQRDDRRVYVMESQLNHQLSVADLHSLSASRLRGKLAADVRLQRRLQHRSRLSLAAEFVRTGLSLLRKLPDKRMGLMCLQFSLASLVAGKRSRLLCGASQL